MLQANSESAIKPVPPLSLYSTVYVETEALTRKRKCEAFSGPSRSAFMQERRFINSVQFSVLLQLT